MDIQTLEDRIAAQALREEARAHRTRRAEVARLRRRRAKLVQAARAVTTGQDDDGHWLAFPADTDPSGMRALGVIGAVLTAAAVGAPALVWLSPWLLLPWFLLASGAAFWAGLRWGVERPVRLVVTPRGYWAFFDGTRLRASGRVEDLRVHVGGYVEGSAAHGMRYVAVYGPDRKLCESEQLAQGATARIRRFGEGSGARVTGLR